MVKNVSGVPFIADIVVLSAPVDLRGHRRVGLLWRFRSVGPIYERKD
jgi:hypothetical protein